jgi:uncharacterized membrane protein
LDVLLLLPPLIGAAVLLLAIDRRDFSDEAWRTIELVWAATAASTAMLALSTPPKADEAIVANLVFCAAVAFELAMMTVRR